MFARLRSTRRATSLLNRFRKEDAGNVAMLFGVALVPTLAFAGMAVDYSRATSERGRLQQAIDSTALSLAHDAKSLTDSELQARAQKALAAVFTPKEGFQPKVAVSKDGMKIAFTSEMTVPTSLMRLMGQTSMTVHANTTVSTLGRQIELALALDNTGSMGSSGKLTALKAAAISFLDELASSNPAPGDVRVTLVPYNMWVNVGASAASQPWMDMSKVTASTWKGCVEERQPDYDINADPGSRYPAVNCSYLPEQIFPLVDLTTPGALAALKSRISAMDSDGSTNVQMGVVWGLAGLSPNGPLPGVGPRPFGTKGVDKIMVVLTDGLNTSRKSRWGSTSATVADERTLMACANVKDPAKKIRLITIRLVDGDDDMLRKCASTPADFYQAAKAAEVPKIFKAILAGLTNVRLMN